MGEKRHAKKVILVRRGQEDTRKVEVFCGDLFPGKTFEDMLGEDVREGREFLFRLRVDGKWFPARRKTLYTKEELNHILTEIVGE